jgi:hypothetical protein
MALKSPDLGNSSKCRCFKGTVALDFLPSVFFSSNPPRPTNGLKKHLAYEFVVAEIFEKQ